ncbi:aminotransferase class I/II-fold pyridoxal phosphate-dependent enzyme [Longispora albida]|uniref:MocR-like transcription factor YczR n=1 Tax=Longispora albida TaxID=203523 RepID=UPI00036A6E68
MTRLIGAAQLARLLGTWRDNQADYLALASAVHRLIVDGRLQPGIRLPAEREAALALGASRTTVTAAYGRLRDSGFLVSRRGAGSWTALPEGHQVATSGLWTPDDTSDVLDLGCAAMPAPVELLEAAREAVEELPAHAGRSGYTPIGLEALRGALAARYTERGLPTTPGQILICGGAQQAFDLCLRLLLSPGEQALVEAPTYANALVALTANRARVAAYGLTPTGWDPEAIGSALRQGRPRIGYLIPDFHNPTGHLMPADLREQLAVAAHQAGTDLIVDETFAELPIEDQVMPPPLAAFDRHARVLTIGGLSKSHWGGLRVGWIRAAGPVIQRLAALRTGLDMGSPVLEQLTAVHLLERDLLPARRAILRSRRDALVGALRETFPDWRFPVPAGGMSLWVELDAPVSTALARAAEAYRVRVAAGPRFGLDGLMERFIRVPFTLPEESLQEVVRRLALSRADVERGIAGPGRAPLDIVA